jgi:methyl-accepting chemotaxis protein
LHIPGGQDLSILIASPHAELLADILDMQKNIAIFVFLLLLEIGVTIYFSRLASQPLNQLSEEAKKIAHFDFHSKIEIETRIREIADLADSMKGMKATIQSFLDIASSLASENNYDRLLARVLKEMSEITGAKSGLLYLYEPQKNALNVVQIYADHQVIETDAQSVPMSDHSHPVVAACHSGSQIMQLQAGDLKLFSVLYLSRRM